MRRIPRSAWLLVVLSAGLQIAMFPTGGPMPVWRAAIGWFCLTPFLVALLGGDKQGAPLRLRDAAVLGYLCGFLWYFGNCFWIYQTMYLYGGLPKPVAFGIVILFSLYLGLYHALFAAGFAMVGRGRLGAVGSLCLAPFLWVAVELARARVTGFPWDLLGYTQVDNSFVTGIAPVAGVMGISFVVAAINAGLAVVLVEKTRHRAMIAGVALVSAILLQLAPLLTFGPSFDRKPGPELAVMLQENLAVGAQGREFIPMSKQEELEVFAKLSQQPHLAVRKGSGQVVWPVVSIAAGGLSSFDVRPRILLWPEAPADLYSTDPSFRASVGELARKTGLPVIAGSLGVDMDQSSRRGYYKYDSASLFDASGSYRGRYDKIHLVPWGEYVPFKALFFFADKLTAGVGDMDPGHLRSVFNTGGHHYGIFICYESIFGDEVRQFAKNGAEVLVNISDDGWYGETGAPWQHLNMARMRAIENHRWVLRSTNTGVTTAIDPLGRIAAEAPRHVRAAFAFPFEFETGITVYTRFGDWFATVCAVVAGASVVFGFWKGYRPR